MPNLTIFSGINGCGKTTLFHALNKYKYFDFGQRVNPDEILKSNKWDWKDIHDVATSGLIAKQIMLNCIKNKTSFNWETTILSHSSYNILQEAKNNGFVITIFFIGTHNCQECIDRVNFRVAKGGHGINEFLIRDRFEHQYRNIPYLIELADYFYLIDNQFQPQLVGYFKNGKQIMLNEQIPWVNENFTNIV